MLEAFNVTNNFNVSLDFYESTNIKRNSSLTFFYIDEKAIEGGLQGLKHYKSIAQDHWALPLENLSYDGNDIDYIDP